MSSLGIPEHAITTGMMDEVILNSVNQDVYPPWFYKYEHRIIELKELMNNNLFYSKAQWPKCLFRLTDQFWFYSFESEPYHISGGIFGIHYIFRGADNCDFRILPNKIGREYLIYDLRDGKIYADENLMQKFMEKIDARQNLGNH
jgi:hypothetical protein